MSTSSPNPITSGRPAAPSNAAPLTPKTALPPSVRFNKQLNTVADKSRTKPELIRGLGGILKSQGCHALWIVTRGQNNQWSQPISVLGDDAALQNVTGGSVQTTVNLVQSNRSLIVVETQELAGHVLIAAPAVTGELVSDVLIALYPTTNSSGIPFDWTFSQAVDCVSKWQMHRFVLSSQHQLSSLSSFVNMAAAMNRTDNRLDAAITLVNELKNATGSGHVALMLRSGKKGPCKLAAMSGVEYFDRNAATTQTIESTVLGIEEQPTFWYQTAEEEAADAAELKINLQNFCDLVDAAGCAVLPLRNGEDHLFGWLLMGMTRAQCGKGEQTEKQFRQIASLVAGQMETVLKSQRTMTQICIDNTRRMLKKRLARKLGLIGAIVAIVMCIPFTYKIPCDCELQLTSRRFVAAPYEGLLEKTLVENGDVVTAGQTLARMDASQLRMEMSALQANLQSERKKRDSALARGSVAESQIARSEMKRLESELAIISDRLENTEIRSPVPGVIVSGDLDKAEGAPMEMGQNLFEVGPLEKVLVEVHIPENEIQHAKPGMDVRFEFGAFPFETFQGTIERIHPRAEVIDDGSVFVAEIQLDNASGQLRPGLKGRAKILGNRHPLGWNLFHGAFEKARQWLIW